MTINLVLEDKSVSLQRERVREKIISKTRQRWREGVCSTDKNKTTIYRFPFHAWLNVIECRTFTEFIEWIVERYFQQKRTTRRSRRNEEMKMKQKCVSHQKLLYRKMCVVHYFFQSFRLSRCVMDTRKPTKETVDVTMANVHSNAIFTRIKSMKSEICSQNTRRGRCVRVFFLIFFHFFFFFFFFNFPLNATASHLIEL